MPKVLVVDDDRTLAGLLRVRLKQEGYGVAVSYDGPSALNVARKLIPDLIILDLLLPKLSGLAVCREIRRDPKLQSAAILILTGQGDEADRILGLEVGADDYLVKPVSLREIVARVRALLRRAERAETNGHTGHTLRVGDIVIETESHTVTVGDRRIHLSALEFRFLCLLAANAGHIVSREEILRQVWGEFRNVAPRSVDTYFWHLRSKIETDPSRPIHLKTIRGEGFLLAIEKANPTNIVPLRAKGVAS